jgi:hypothetical protein
MRLGIRALGFSCALALGLAFHSAFADDNPRAVRPAADSGSTGLPRAADGDMEGTPSLKIRRRTLESLNVDPELGREVNAGVIPRAALHAELTRGVGQFLRQVRAEPALTRGRFVGWRLVQLFVGRQDVHVLVLRPGDTVLRVNGRSMERPEEFKAIWDSLDGAQELVLDIQRGGRASKLRYSIANDSADSGPAPAAADQPGSCKNCVMRTPISPSTSTKSP